MHRTFVPVFHLGIEDMEPVHWVTWVFELPGCFSSATSREAALANAPQRIREHLKWLDEHGRPAYSPEIELQVEVAETFQSWKSEEDYIVNAFFEYDRNPLSEADIQQAIWLLDLSRQALMQVVSRVPGDQFDRPDERAMRGSIGGTLSHIATAEWWYLDRLDMAFPRQELPAEPLPALDKVRAHTKSQLPKLANDERIVELNGEQWSARKVLRRALWHEADHTAQIASLIKQKD